jgi:hypothetical protein
MTALILIVLYFVVAGFVYYADQKATGTWESRSEREAYERQEAARLHADDLAEIARIRRATAEEMIRVAVGDADVIEGTAIEIRRR